MAIEAPLDEGYDPRLLQRELLRRGLGWQHLSKSGGGPFNPNTLTKLRAGARVAPNTSKRLAEFLRGKKVIPELDALVRKAEA
jgi:hypothetical protein